jgi:hypothetical protein
VNFFDDSEVLLWPDGRWVTYKGKTKERATYDMAHVLAVPDLAKRIKVRPHHAPHQAPRHHTRTRTEQPPAAAALATASQQQQAQHSVVNSMLSREWDDCPPLPLLNHPPSSPKSSPNPCIMSLQLKHTGGMSCSRFKRTLLASSWCTERVSLPRSRQHVEQSRAQHV